MELLLHVYTFRLGYDFHPGAGSDANGHGIVTQKHLVPQTNMPSNGEAEGGRECLKMWRHAGHAKMSYNLKQGRSEHAPPITNTGFDPEFERHKCVTEEEA